MVFTTTDPSVTYTKAPAGSISLAGKRVAVVGGTDGLGRAIARLAASKGAEPVIVAGRTFRDQGADKLVFVKTDLSLMTAAAQLGKDLPADLDVLILTAGIMPGPERKATPEGIEMDMAVSCLSRHVLLKTLLPRLTKPKETRVFIMGFPGNGQTANLEDFNSETSYAGGLSQAHINTVAANEAMVHHYAASGAKVYGLNPGLVATGIRSNWNGGLMGRAMEWAVGLFAPTPEQYAESVLPLFVAPELAAHAGASFSQQGVPILPSPAFKDPDVVAKHMAALDRLATKAQQLA